MSAPRPTTYVVRPPRGLSKVAERHLLKSRGPALLPRRALMAAVRAYRFLLKPWLGSACRFEPSCSAYALQALDKHGAAAGTYLVSARLLRCHPWCHGGLDPVPSRAPLLFTRFFAKTHP